MNPQLAQALQHILWQDPSNRGPACAAAQGCLGLQDHFGQAAQSLLGAKRVVLFTGFPIPLAGTCVPETDGPPAALLLAWALQRLGTQVAILADPWAWRFLLLGVEMLGLNEDLLRPIPPLERSSPGGLPAGLEELLSDCSGEPITHLVAIERPGPSHHRESLARWNFSPLEQHEWISRMGLGAQDLCFNMHGQSIHRWSASGARVFEHLAQRFPDVVTIGIWDGGNELGAGTVSPRELVQVVRAPWPHRILSRVGCRFSLVSGASNWAGYALAAHLAQQAGCLATWPGREFVAQLILQATSQGLCVDGFSRQAQPRVDGQPLEHELEVLDQITATVDRFAA